MKSIQFTHADKLTLQDLMFHHIHEILLVASPYDSFVLEEDGRDDGRELAEVRPPPEEGDKGVGADPRAVARGRDGGNLACGAH